MLCVCCVRVECIFEYVVRLCLVRSVLCMSCVFVFVCMLCFFVVRVLAYVYVCMHACCVCCVCVCLYKQNNVYGWMDVVCFFACRVLCACVLYIARVCVCCAFVLHAFWSIILAAVVIALLHMVKNCACIQEWGMPVGAYFLHIHVCTVEEMITSRPDWKRGMAQVQTPSKTPSMYCYIHT